MPQQGQEAVEPAKDPSLPRRGPRRVSVSPEERTAYDLRYSTDPPMSWAKMARRLKRDPRGVQRACERAERKIPKEGQLEPAGVSYEARKPEVYSRIVSELAHPDAEGQTFASIARRTGVAEGTVATIAKDLETTKLPMKIEARNVSTERMKQLWGTMGERALEAMTEDKFEDASLYQLGTVAGIATDKLLLLRALPSQTVRSEADRMKLELLAQTFMQEAERRGYSVNADTATGVVDVEYTRKGGGADA